MSNLLNSSRAKSTSRCFNVFKSRFTRRWFTRDSLVWKRLGVSLRSTATHEQIRSRRDLQRDFIVQVSTGTVNRDFARISESDDAFYVSS